MRRCDCSTKTTPSIVSTPTATTMSMISMPRLWPMPQIAPGKVEAIEVKMSSDMPLPMPRSVMSSPIHMMRPVPAVMVTTMSRIAAGLSLVMSWLHSGTPADWENSAPLRATVMRVVDWSTPSAIVR
jgi:hypothetical protein